MLCCACHMEASQIVWGNSVNPANVDVNFNSRGGALDNSFIFATGTFGQFTPTEENAGLWASNWKPLDQANYNPLYDYFTSGATLNDNSLFAAGEKACIWVYNSQSPVAGSQWLLVRGIDKNSAPWNIPAAIANQTNFPLFFRIRDVRDVVFGGCKNVPNAGRIRGEVLERGDSIGDPGGRAQSAGACPESIPPERSDVGCLGGL